MGEYIGPMTNGLIEKISEEMNKEETKEKILEKVISPLMTDIMCKFYPHIIGMSIIFLLIIVLLCSILYVVITQTGCKCENK